VPAARAIADGGLAGIPAGGRLRDVAAFGSSDWGHSRRGKRGPGLASLYCEARLHVLFVKGASLAVLAFGTLGLSSAQDFDLLVPLETLPAVS
jgi:hypothetical protein